MRNVIVTGASRGLGLAMARELAGSGYRVIAIARKLSAELAAAAESLDAGAGAIEFRACDLSDLGGIGALVRGLRKDFGPLYGLINNAGLGTSGMLSNMLDRDVQRLVQLNTVSPMLLSKYAVRSMMLQREGRIVNIASIVAATGYSGLSVYSATKASLIGFTRSLAREVGQFGITVNALSPGFVDTEMTHALTEAQREKIARRSALHRMPEPIDVARSAAYLMSEGGRNITGTVITIDAGNTA
ncbi:MAG TPA: SDR family NAD(P)-dependent oxidoreductase [Steroidobacteraceae bacterium]|nr:SDR family NAD(P)-dependent oxidoreductase [Steroidobacteraceae bacterium]